MALSGGILREAYATRSAPGALKQAYGSGGSGGGGGGGGFGAAVRFDGTNDFASRAGDLVGVTNSKLGIISFWFRSLENSVAGRIYHANAGFVDLIHHVQDNIQFQGFGPDPSNFTVVNTLPTTSDILVADGWTWVGISWDINVATRFAQVFFGDTAVIGTPTFQADDVVDYTRGSSHTVGSSDATANVAAMNMDLADLYFNIGESIDFSVEANRRKFFSAAGKPVDLGSDGSIPTGTRPPVFLNGNAAKWNAGNANDGSGGAFTVTGALEDSPDGPGD